MTHDKTGGQSFPTTWPDQCPGEGMTLRDWFAGQALAGLVTLDADCGPLGYASDAYAMADAMLIKRAKGGDT